MKSKKLITGLLAIGLLAGATGGIYYLTDGFTTIDFTTRFQAKQTCTFEINNELNLESGSTVSLPKNILVKQTKEEAEIKTKASINISAGVSSTKKLTWKAVFVQGADKVSDYISIEPSDDTFTAKLTINQAFNNQIKITISSSNGLSNDIYLDYAKRYDSIDNNIITYSESFDIEEIESSKKLIDNLNELIDNLKINVVGTIGTVNYEILLNSVYTETEFNIDNFLDIEEDINFNDFFKNYNSTALSDYLIKYMVINSSIGLENYNSYLSERLKKCYYEDVKDYWADNLGFICFEYKIKILNDDDSSKEEKAIFKFKYGSIKANELVLDTTNLQF